MLFLRKEYQYILRQGSVEQPSSARISILIPGVSWLRC